MDRLGRFAQAETHYKKALKLSPKDPKIWNDAGYSYYLQGRWADAERALKTAVRLAPDDERIRTNLGLTLAALGRTKRSPPALEPVERRGDRSREPRLPAGRDRTARPGPPAIRDRPGVTARSDGGPARTRTD